MKLDKKRFFFIISFVIIIAFILYLGGRAIKHEILSRQYQSQQFAKSRIDNIALMVRTLLEQKAVHLEAISNFIEPTENNIHHLIENEIDIKNIFMIKENSLLYPSNYSLDIFDSQKQQWLMLVDSIQNDPSVLFAHYMDSEQAKPHAGWYITHDNDGPVLIYWIYQNNQLIGFQLSYIKLLLDLILELDNHALSDPFIITENGQVIYDNLSNNVQYKNAHTISFIFDYPLKGWQIEYHYQDKNNTTLYLIGISALIIIIGFIIAIFIYSYREYTRTLRLAKQQVSFVGQVSHEFKTPLTNITLYSEMLKERLEDELSPIPEYLDIITQESQRLTRLIQNVLNFSKSSKIATKKIHLNALLEKNCQIFKPVLAKRAVVLNFTPCIGDDVIESDEDNIAQIINNLLSNAEKYASKGGKVDLSIIKTENHFSISVRDYGDGIPSQSLSMIFKPFYRLNSSLNEGVSGTGIGLTIAKQLAIQLEGDITVQNTNPGAEFTLILPVKMNNRESK